MTITTYNLRKVLTYLEKHGKTWNYRMDATLARMNMDKYFMDTDRLTVMLMELNDCMGEHTVRALVSTLADEGTWK